jgi:lysophospholipase L1-like esterase
MTQFVAFGDSITWGEDGDPQLSCGSNNNSSPFSLGPIRIRQRVPPNSQYPMALQLKLAARYTNQASQIIVDNQGNPGEPAGDGTAPVRFQQVLASKRYDAVLLMEGTNDIFYGDSSRIPAAISGLSSMLSTARSRGVRAFLATVPPMVPGGSRACGNRLVVPLNDQIKVLAASQGVTLVDVYAGMGSAFAQYIGPDGLHPNVAGYDNIATTFFTVLRNSLEVTAVTTSTMPAPPTTMPFAAPSSASPRSPVRPRR